MLFGIPEMAWWYPAFAFTLLVNALLLIPRASIKDLFFESLMWGFVFSKAFGVTLSALHIYHYEHQGPFTFLGAPIWLSFAWMPAIMVFLHFKPLSIKPVRFWGYILAFSLMSAMLDESMHRMGLLTYIHWSPLARFCVAVVWFWAAAYVHERYFAKQT